MEKLELQGSFVLWSIRDKKWILNYQEITTAYLTSKHPHTNKKLSTATINRILNIIKKFAGEQYIPSLKKIKNYKKFSQTQLQNCKNKLGNGKYATVYECSGCAVKVIEHKFYKGLPKLDGSLEVRMLKLLYQEITNNYISPNIITLYQYTPTTHIDYVVMEKLHETFWTLLQKKQTARGVKGILIQVLFTLLVLQKTLPGFRHNDLKVDNVLLDKTPRSNPITLRYKKHFWVIPNNIPLVKLADFDYSNIPSKITNCKVGTGHAKSFGCVADASEIYDLHLFLNSLYSYRINLPTSIVEWLQKQLPKNTRGNDNVEVKYGRLKNPGKWESKLNNPLDLLTSKFFSEFITVKPRFPVWGIK